MKPVETIVPVQKILAVPNNVLSQHLKIGDIIYLKHSIETVNKKGNKYQIVKGTIGGKLNISIRVID